MMLISPRGESPARFLLMGVRNMTGAWVKVGSMNGQRKGENPRGSDCEREEY